MVFRASVRVIWAWVGWLFLIRLLPERWEAFVYVITDGVPCLIVYNLKELNFIHSAAFSFNWIEGLLDRDIRYIRLDRYITHRECHNNYTDVLVQLPWKKGGCTKKREQLGENNMLIQNMQIQSVAIYIMGRDSIVTAQSMNQCLLGLWEVWNIIQQQTVCTSCSFSIRAGQKLGRAEWHWKKSQLILAIVNKIICLALSCLCSGQLLIHYKWCPISSVKEFRPYPVRK